MHKERPERTAFKLQQGHGMPAASSPRKGPLGILRGDMLNPIQRLDLFQPFFNAAP